MCCVQTLPPPSNFADNISVLLVVRVNLSRLENAACGRLDSTKLLPVPPLIRFPALYSVRLASPHLSFVVSITLLALFLHFGYLSLSFLSVFVGPSPHILLLLGALDVPELTWSFYYFLISY
jgi:hypothetical protein